MTKMKEMALFKKCVLNSIKNVSLHHSYNTVIMYYTMCVHPSKHKS